MVRGGEQTERRECKQTEANGKQLTSFPYRGKNINTGTIIRCSSVYIFTSARRWGGNGRMKWEGKSGNI